MSRSSRTARAAAALLLPAAAVLLGSPGPAVSQAAAAAPECLAAPNDTPTAGRRWFYRLDRASNRKCWYLREAGEPRSASAQSADATPPTGESRAAASPEPRDGRSRSALSPTEVETLFHEFLAWRLQQPPE